MKEMKWFVISDEGAYKGVIKYTKVVELRNSYRISNRRLVVESWI
jgi:hypothetical protein